MNTETVTATITNMVSQLEDAPIASCTASGDPLRKASRIIGGRHVTVKLIGWEGRVVVEIDRSTEPLTITESAARVAA